MSAELLVHMGEEDWVVAIEGIRLRPLKGKD